MLVESDRTDRPTEMWPICAICLFSLLAVSNRIHIKYGIDHVEILYKLISIANYVNDGWKAKKPKRQKKKVKRKTVFFFTNFVIRLKKNIVVFLPLLQNWCWWIFFCFFFCFVFQQHACIKKPDDGYERCSKFYAASDVVAGGSGRSVYLPDFFVGAPKI